MQKIRPDMDIGHNIQRLRRNTNMTQDQVVAQLQLMGIDHAEYSLRGCCSLPLSSCQCRRLWP